MAKPDLQAAAFFRLTTDQLETPRRDVRLTCRSKARRASRSDRSARS